MRILSVARSEFAKRGLGQTTLDDIANAALLAKGTLYQYFSTKDDIYQILKKDFFGKLNSFLLKIFPSSSHLDLKKLTTNIPFSPQPRNRLEMRQYLTRFFVNFCQFYTEEADGFRLFLGDQIHKASEVKQSFVILEKYIQDQKVRGLIKSSVASPVLGQILLIVWTQMFIKWSTGDRAKLFGIVHTDEFVSITLDLLKIDS